MLIKNLACLGGLLCLLVGHGAWAGEIQVGGAWVREAPPTAKALAAYMVITNASQQPVKLMGAEAPAFSTVEVHQSMQHGGMMHMMAVENVVIAPGTSVTLEPGGYHLMLMEPRERLKSGDVVLLRLHFDNDEVLPVNAVVKKHSPQ